jgi:hypothetical protein
MDIRGLNAMIKLTKRACKNKVAPEQVIDAFTDALEGDDGDHHALVLWSALPNVITAYAKANSQILGSLLEPLHDFVDKTPIDDDFHDSAIALYCEIVDLQEANSIVSAQGIGR